MKLRVGICEDDPFTRATLEAALSFEDFEVQFSVGSPGDALREASLKLPHAVLLDLHLGKGPTGLDLARKLRASHPEIGVVFLTSFESPRLLDKNFSGFPTGSQFLVKSQIASVGEIAAALQRSIHKIETPRTVASNPLFELTTNQLEVLKHLSSGKSNQEIAAAVGSDAKNIEAVITRIAKKLKLSPEQGRNQRVQMARAYLKASGGLHGAE